MTGRHSRIPSTIQFVRSVVRLCQKRLQRGNLLRDLRERVFAHDSLDVVEQHRQQGGHLLCGKPPALEQSREFKAVLSRSAAG